MVTVSCCPVGANGKGRLELSTSEANHDAFCQAGEKLLLVPLHLHFMGLNNQN